MELWTRTAKKRLMANHLDKATVPDIIREWLQLTDPTAGVGKDMFLFCEINSYKAIWV